MKLNLTNLHLYKHLILTYTSYTYSETLSTDNMAGYEPYSDQRVMNVALSWLQNGLTDVHIVMGPLIVWWETNIFNSTIRILTAEAGQVSATSLRWFEIKYIALRCIYGFLRMLGVISWEWEVTNEYQNFDMVLYQELIRPYQPHLRVKYPQQITNPLCVENMVSHSYMKVYPFFNNKQPTTLYPRGNSTSWVDQFQNKNPHFNLDLAPAMDEEGEGFVA